MKTTIKKVVLILLILSVYFFIKYMQSGKSICSNMDIPVYNTDSISKFIGNDQNNPIYIAFEGCVYDVTPGKDKFYGPNMDYNYLTGKDSTDELHIAGGAIIKSKYKIVGKFIK